MASTYFVLLKTFLSTHILNLRKIKRKFFFFPDNTVYSDNMPIATSFYSPNQK